MKQSAQQDTDATGFSGTGGTFPTRAEIVNALRQSAAIVVESGYAKSVAKTLNKMAVVLTQGAERAGYISNFQVELELDCWYDAIAMHPENSPEEIFVVFLGFLADVIEKNGFNDDDDAWVTFDPSLN